MRYIALIITSVCTFAMGCTQTVKHYLTTSKANWAEYAQRLSSEPMSDIILTVNPASDGIPFQAWGTTFNELDLDAFNILTRQEQEKVMSDLYSPEGDLRFTRGRVSMNANDYAREWYSCSDIAGDFQLKYFILITTSEISSRLHALRSDTALTCNYL